MSTKRKVPTVKFQVLPDSVVITAHLTQAQATNVTRLMEAYGQSADEFFDSWCGDGITEKLRGAIGDAAEAHTDLELANIIMEGVADNWGAWTIPASAKTRSKFIEAAVAWMPDTPTRAQAESLVRFAAAAAWAREHDTAEDYIRQAARVGKWKKPAW